MCWQCDNPDATIDDYLKELRHTIRGHGWTVQHVEHDKRPFAYTIGLQERGLPELLMTGPTPRVAHIVLNSTAHMIVDDGTELEPAMHIDHEDRFLMEVVEVEHPDVHLKMAVNLYGPRFRALQLVWSDNHGRFPWERYWDHGRRRQSVLGARTPVG
ncbi:hypothetical protein BH10ACT9_BH10ACT9_41360 [soil metagenome]